MLPDGSQAGTKIRDRYTGEDKSAEVVLQIFLLFPKVPMWETRCCFPFRQVTKKEKELEEEKKVRLLLQIIK
jgi:hypothetical protein